MDWNAAIEKNREALKRILAALAAMAGLDAIPTSPCCGSCVRPNPPRAD